ncbi:MAG: hypothetical protein ACYDGO_14480 [Smithellaceae bacterium]
MDQKEITTEVIEMIEFAKSVEKLRASCDLRQRRLYEDEPVSARHLCRVASTASK